MGDRLLNKSVKEYNRDVIFGFKDLPAKQKMLVEPFLKDDKGFHVEAKSIFLINALPVAASNDIKPDEVIAQNLEAWLKAFKPPVAVVQIFMDMPFQLTVIGADKSLTVFQWTVLTRLFGERVDDGMDDDFATLRKMKNSKTDFGGTLGIVKVLQTQSVCSVTSYLNGNESLPCARPDLEAFLMGGGAPESIWQVGLYMTDIDDFIRDLRHVHQDADDLLASLGLLDNNQPDSSTAKSKKGKGKGKSAPVKGRVPATVTKSLRPKQVFVPPTPVPFAMLEKDQVLQLVGRGRFDDYHDVCPGKLEHYVSEMGCKDNHTPAEMRTRMRRALGCAYLRHQKMKIYKKMKKHTQGHEAPISRGYALATGCGARLAQAGATKDNRELGRWLQLQKGLIQEQDKRHL